MSEVFYYLGAAVAILAGWSLVLGGGLVVLDHTTRWLEGHRALLLYAFYRKRFHEWVKEAEPEEAAQFGMRLNPMPRDVRSTLEDALEVLEDEEFGHIGMSKLANRVRGTLERYPE